MYLLHLRLTFKHFYIYAFIQNILHEERLTVKIYSNLLLCHFYGLSVWIIQKATGRMFCGWMTKRRLFRLKEKCHKRSWQNIYFQHENLHETCSSFADLPSWSCTGKLSIGTVTLDSTKKGNVKFRNFLIKKETQNTQVEAHVRIMIKLI